MNLSRRHHGSARVIGVVLSLALVIGLIVASVYLPARHPGYLSLAVEDCRRQYAAAQGGTDSARVDLVIPSTGGQKGWTAQRCGLLRQSGALK